MPSTSVSRGTSVSSSASRVSTAQAIIGKTAFLERCTRTSPRRGGLFSIPYCAIFLPLSFAPSIRGARAPHAGNGRKRWGKNKTKLALPY